MVAAISHLIWDNGAHCDKFYRVRCAGRSGSMQPCKNGEITVKIIETCPGCSANQIELSMDAFEMITDLDYGRIDVEYYPI